MPQSICDQCENYICFDDGEYYCNVSLDEDEMARYMQGNTSDCPYFKFYDEYKMVRRQN